MTTRDQEQIARVAKMDWNELEAGLAASATRGPGARTGDDEALEKFFGPEELAELQRIAAQTRALRDRAPLLGNLVFLPGIMGSNLTATAPSGDTDLIWVHLLRLVGGGVERLRLSPDGGSDAGGQPVHASEVEKRTYTKAILKLGVRWRVHPFPYDWRRNLDAASNALDGFLRNLRARFPGEPVNLVAHSLGGLVSRNFIRLHGDLWDEMRGDNTGGRGGRLVMLGTPNYGSFAIHQAMTGTEKLVRWLEKADLRHDMQEVLEILNSFVGSYQLLPAPGKIPAEVREIYKAGTWGMLPISQAHLDTAQAFHRNLESAETTIDPRRMFYVAGCNQETLLTLTIQGPGEFRYVTTHQGDGRVPFTLGLLKDVPTYYVEEGHGSLPKNDSVLKAVDQLLERGRTDALPDKPIPPRAFFVPEARWHRSVGEYLVESELEKIAQQAGAETADADEVRFAEEMLTRAAAGDDRPARQPGQRRAGAAVPRPVPGGPRRALTVEVVHGDVRQVAAPVVVVGSYKGVVPVSAIGVIDQALDFWISQAMQRSMLGAELGQVFFIPIRRKQIAAGAVLVAGMGEEGKFSRHDLRYLMLNVTYAISALEADSFATVLLGTGQGGLPPETAVRSLLFGVCDALARVGEDGIKRLVVVEYDEQRARKIEEILETVKAEDSAGGLEIRIVSKTLKKDAGWPEPERPADLPATEFGSRITVERDGDIFRFAALTPQAVVSVREVDIQSFYSEGIAEGLMSAVVPDEQEMYGRLLNTGLIPREFQEHYREPLTLIVDRSTAGFPWEMACYDRPEGPAFFGTHLGLTRQFRTMLSSGLGIAPRLDKRLRVLVIADPAPEQELQLPGARREGQEVVDLLRRIKQEEKLDMEVIGRIGHEECDPIEILGLVLNGTFDIIHFAGHGIYDSERPNRSGWVFGLGKDGRTLKTLSAREIFLARRVPRLVFSNACFSAVVTQGRLSAEDMNRRLAGLAEAFFERGVPNYIGAGWPVRDDLAVTFATELYAQALTGRPAAQYSMMAPAGRRSKRSEPQVLWQAVAAARQLIAHDGSTWGAYHHYGQADARLLSAGSDRPVAAPSPGPAAGARRKPGAKPKTGPAARRKPAGRKTR